MIGTVVQIGFRSLLRSKVEMLVVFAVPIAFFSIFALIFGSQGADSTSKFKIVVVDEAQSEFSKRIAEGIAKEKSLDVRPLKEVDGATDMKPTERDRARDMVRSGDVSLAVVIPVGVNFAFGPSENAAKIALLYDASDRIAPQIVMGLLQKIGMQAAPDLMIRESGRWFDQSIGGMTGEQRAHFEKFTKDLNDVMNADSRPESAPLGGAAESKAEVALVPCETIDVLRESKNTNIIAFYAAGIGVMFLLFSAAGAGGTLLEEEENSTLERLLATPLGMTRLLIGKWIFLTLSGFVQILVMFLWGAAVFGLDFFSHIPGFFVMTVVTAGAASSYGLLLATLCRSRAQLSGVSTILNLMMSAAGGSMFPRFLMSETLQKVGLVTFNAWALDGYVKVFWRDASIVEILPQVAVLVLIAVLLFVFARLAARRWERI